MRLIPLLLASAAVAYSAPRCNEQNLAGPYGLQLWGETLISGNPAPAAAIARLVFDGQKNVSGYSSVNFNGLLLGNPVTGSYELNPDCSMTLNLQDDSGAYQHFKGTVTPGGNKASLRQTDPGTGERGIMQKTPESCQDIGPNYAYTLSGTLTSLATGGASQAVSAEGVLFADSLGKFTFIQKLAGGANSTGKAAVEVQSDCIVNFEFNPDDIAAKSVKFRGILVNGGKEILAIQTDPGQTVGVRFTAR